MAESKEAKVDVHEDAGVAAKQVKPTNQKSAREVKASILHEPSRDIHPAGDPEHAADQTSVPTEYAPIERPPVSTTKPVAPIVQSLVTGAGRHEPPDPEKYDAQGRPRDDGTGS